MLETHAPWYVTIYCRTDYFREFLWQAICLQETICRLCMTIIHDFGIFYFSDFSAYSSDISDITDISDIFDIFANI